jgi:tungstate transport system permease protein
MHYLIEGIKKALEIIFSFDREFLQIVSVSIKASFASTLLATLTAVPFGIFMAEKKFPGRDLFVNIINTLMALPTVVVGLLVYSFLSRSGPLGRLGLLYSLAAMIIGQAILAFPIISGLTISSVRSLDRRLSATLLSLGANSMQSFWAVLREGRFGILAAIIAGFGRVFAEVGISMMLGGNIRGYTRNITTAIALETNKGEFSLGIALGIVLLTVAFAINVLFFHLHNKAR